MKIFPWFLLAVLGWLLAARPARAWVHEGRDGRKEDSFCLPHVVRNQNMWCYRIKSGNPICADGSVYDAAVKIAAEVATYANKHLGFMKDGRPRLEMHTRCRGRNCSVEVKANDPVFAELKECGVGPIPQVQYDPDNEQFDSNKIH